MLAFMEFQRVIKSRRMARDFDDRPLAPGVLERIVANSLRAPSAGFTQGVELLVLEGPQETARYWDACFPEERRGSFRWPGLMRAPVLIVVLGREAAYINRYAEPDKAGTGGSRQAWPAPWWHVDAAFVAMVMLLSAVDAGVGALFFAAFDPESLATEFGIPDEFKPTGVVALGYPKPHTGSPSLSRGRRPSEEMVHYGHW